MKRLDLIVIAVVVLAAAGLIVVKQASKRRPLRSSSGGAGSKVLSGADLTEALKSGRPTMAEFGLGTCQVCREMAPVLEAAAGKLEGKANIISVDLDEHVLLGRYYQIRAMPTQVFFDKAGNQVERHVGKLTMEEISGKLAALGAR